MFARAGNYAGDSVGTRDASVMDINRDVPHSESEGND